MLCTLTLAKMTENQTPKEHQIIFSQIFSNCLSAYSETGDGFGSLSDWFLTWMMQILAKLLTLDSSVCMFCQKVFPLLLQLFKQRSLLRVL